MYLTEGKCVRANFCSSSTRLSFLSLFFTLFQKSLRFISFVLLNSINRINMLPVSYSWHTNPLFLHTFNKLIRKTLIIHTLS
ncbi:hypothetical protein VIGAN_05118400 [Vigna angularis var. angularis]|uniref:Uncharacterized protein n=1 Tax=Vigna angularis var. angularis TaxID=157739 RepID=A0A0S3S4L1_PHAAN|nr:hypothetical protein VIGAN_05118400 [Vigna angularis var. angularis]